MSILGEKDLYVPEESPPNTFEDAFSDTEEEERFLPFDLIRPVESGFLPLPNLDYTPMIEVGRLK